MDIIYSAVTQEWVLFLNRLVIGVVMIYYGWPKIKDLKATAGQFNGMGVKPGHFWGTLIALLEFFGGLAIIVSIYAELFATLFAFEMIIGIIYKVTKTNKSFKDWSHDLQLMVMSLILVFFGSGLFTLISVL